MAALERAFDGEAESALRAIDSEARRNLVGAIEKLIFRRGAFRRAARLLLTFSTAETESYSNNATGLFKDLFHLFLSGTEAIGDEKLALADEILASNDEHWRAIVVYGLADGLRTDHFTRMGGAEAQGSGRPLQDWQPTPSEASDYLQGIITRLTEIGCGSGGLAAQARDGIAHNLRGLIGAGPPLFRAVAEAIEKIIESHGSYWPEALESLTLSLRYEGPGFPDEFRREVEGLRKLLLPTDLTDRLKFFVSDLPWGFMGSDMDGAERGARRLADEIARQPQVLFDALPELSYGEQRQTMAFGQRLGAVFDEPMQLLDKALTALAARPNGNPSLVDGIIWGLDQRSPDLVCVALDRCANDDALRPFLGYLTCRKKITSVPQIAREMVACVP